MTTESLSVTIEGELLTVEIGTVAAPTSDGGASAWGAITGTLSDQTDLSTALGLKAPLASPALTGTPTAPTASGGTNTTQIATTAFVSSAVASAVAGLLEFIGNVDASTNPNYSAASKGDSYLISVAGKIGGASGKSVEVGDLVVASADNAGGTEASAGTSWFVLEHNLAGALLTANALSELSGVAGTARTNLGLGTAALLGTSTASTVSTGAATNEAVTPSAYKDSTPFYVDRAADWTLALTDRNKDQWFNNGASALVCTIPLNATVAFAVGDTVPFLRLASGTATIDAATSVTLNGVSGGSCTISTRYQGALLKKIATDSWVVSGDVSAVA